MGIFSSVFSALFSNNENIVSNNVNEFVDMANNNRPPIITFYRYLRFWSPYNVEPVDPNSGITFKITLDYEHGTISYIGAICENDNFSRVRGKQILNDPKFNRQVSKIDMNYNTTTGKYEIDPDMGTLGMIVNHLTNPYRKNMAPLNDADKLYVRHIERMKRNLFIPDCRIYDAKRVREEGIF